MSYTNDISSPIIKLLSYSDESEVISALKDSLIKILGEAPFSVYRKSYKGNLKEIITHNFEKQFKSLLQKANGESGKIMMDNGFQVINPNTTPKVYLFLKTSSPEEFANCKALMLAFVNSPANRPNEKKLKSKEKVLSTISHEIRTPINGILGLSNLLIQNNPKKDQIKALGALRASGENLLNLINDILDYSKIQSGKLVFEHILFNLYDFLKRLELIYKIQAKEKGIQFHLKIHRGVCEQLYGDPTRLAQILNNLLSNALKFTDTGHVQLNVFCREIDAINKCDIVFMVEDTGIGISKDKQQTIFDAFSQAELSTSRRFGGTGLGLSIVNQLVNLLGGKISLQSEENKGSVFEVVLSFDKQEKDFTKQEEINLSGTRILYVDDVSINHMLLKGHTSGWEVEVDTALSGIEAVEKFTTNRYDIILMDLNMPGMDGFEATQRIRETNTKNAQQVPILALTAEIDESDLSKIQDYGLSGYVLKPFRPKALKEAVARNLKPSFKTPTNRKLSYSKIIKKNIDFSTIEKAYSNEGGDIIKYLEDTSDELEQFKTNLLSSIKTNDNELFRENRVNSEELLEILHQEELIKLLDQFQKPLDHHPNELTTEVIKKTISDSFNIIIQEIELKLELMTI